LITRVFFNVTLDGEMALTALFAISSEVVGKAWWVDRSALWHLLHTAAVLVEDGPRFLHRK
jgi:hypothetical protein